MFVLDINHVRPEHVEELHKQHEPKEQELTDALAEKDEFKSALENLQFTHNINSSELKSMEDELTKATANLDQKETAFTKLQAENNELATKLAAVKDELSSLQSSYSWGDVYISNSEASQISNPNTKQLIFKFIKDNFDLSRTESEMFDSLMANYSDQKEDYIVAFLIYVFELKAEGSDVSFFEKNYADIRDYIRSILPPESSAEIDLPERFEHVVAADFESEGVFSTILPLIERNRNGDDSDSDSSSLMFDGSD